MDLVIKDFLVDSRNNHELIHLTVDGDFAQTKYIKLITFERIVVLARNEFDTDFSDECTVFTFRTPSFIIFNIYISNNDFDVVNDKDLKLLDSLFAKDDSEYSKIFRSRPSRPDNVYLNFFVARQLAKAFSGSPCFKIGAAVVEAYKAVELHDKGFISESDKRLNSLYELLELCDYSASPRVNKEHLKFSMLCTHYHLKIMLNDFDGMMDVLHKVSCGVRSVALFFTPSFPINLALLLYSLVAKLNNDEALFQELLRKMEFVYRRAVFDGSIENRRWFRELTVAHDSVCHALTLRDSFLDIVESRDLVKSMFYKSIRVKGKCAHLMYKNFISFFDNDIVGDK